MLIRKLPKSFCLLVYLFFAYTANTSAKSQNNPVPPIANAGPDQTIYLTQTSTATLNGSSSTGSTYLWTDISTDFKSDAIIASPKSAISKISGLKQGTWYFQ